MTIREHGGADHCQVRANYCTLHDCMCGCEKCDPVAGEARAVARDLRTGGASPELIERAAALLEKYPNGNR